MCLPKQSQFCRIFEAAAKSAQHGVQFGLRSVLALAKLGRTKAHDYGEVLLRVHGLHSWLDSLPEVGAVLRRTGSDSIRFLLDQWLCIRHPTHLDQVDLV